MEQPKLIWDGIRVRGDGRPLVFWYVRKSHEAARIAVGKGMIPIFPILNCSYGDYQGYEDRAMAFQAKNDNCIIAMVQQFWRRTATAKDAWNPGEWSQCVEKRIPDAHNRIMMVDVEPAEKSLHDLVNAVSNGTLGISGTPDQVAAMKSFVAAQPKYAFQFPELRDNPFVYPRTTPGSFYAILGLGVRGMNEATYTPGVNAVVGDTVAGMRVSATPKIYHFTPELAAKTFTNLDRFYFPATTVEAEEIDIVNRV